MNDGPPSQEVPAAELRAMHNLARLWHKARTGENGCYYEVVASNHPSAPLANEPFCTKSETLVYRNNEGRQICRAHRYLREDGSLGASGRPDPKGILGADGMLYFVLDPLDA